MHITTFCAHKLLILRFIQLRGMRRAYSAWLAYIFHHVGVHNVMVGMTHGLSGDEHT